MITDNSVSSNVHLGHGEVTWRTIEEKTDHCERSWAIRGSSGVGKQHREEEEGEVTTPDQIIIVIVVGVNLDHFKISLTMWVTFGEQLEGEGETQDKLASNLEFGILKFWNQRQV